MAAILLPGANDPPVREKPPIARCKGCRAHFEQEAAEQELREVCRYWQGVFRYLPQKGQR